MIGQLLAASLAVRRQRAAMLLLVAALLPMMALTVKSPAEAFPKEGDPLVVEITGQEPLNPTVDGTLTFTGTITNRSEQEIEGLEVLLRVSSEQLGSRSDVTAVTDLTTSRRGTTVASTLTPVTDQLPAGETTDFTITAPTSALPFRGNGVYAVFIEARSPAVGSFDTAIPVTWFPDLEDLRASRIVVATGIRAAVDLTADHVLQSPALVSSMSEGGSLFDLATASTSAASAGIPISWLIDPAVTAAAKQLTDGKGSFPESETDTEDMQDSVASWLKTVTEGTSQPTARTYLTPYAEVDAGAVISAGQPALLTQSVAVAPQAASASLANGGAGLIAMPPDGNTTSGALDAYAQESVPQVVLSAAALPPVQSLSYTPSGVSTIDLGEGKTMTAIIPDQRLAAALERPASTPAERFRLQQGLLADAAMISLELPLTSRTVVLLPDQDMTVPADVYAASLTALSQAPYTQLVDLPALLAPDVPSVPRELELDQSDEDQLPAEYLAPIPGIDARLSTFSRVTVDPLGFESDFHAAILRSSSAQWRSDVTAGQALLSSVEQDLTEEESKVTTVSTGTVTFSGSVGTLPLTISNELDQAVAVGVLLEADPPVRLTFTPPGIVLIDAAKRVSIEIPVEVYGSGPVPVSVILTDRDGRPFITTGDLVIKSTATSTVAAAVALIGAVGLIVMVVWRFRRKGADDSE